MLRLAVLLCSFSALAAKPTAEDVLQKFPPATLPITIKEGAELKSKLTAPELEALGFLSDTTPQLAGLRDWKNKPARGEKKVLRPLARIDRARHKLILLRYEHLASKETYLLSYDEKGALLGGLLFHLELAGQNDLSTLDQAGVVSRLIRITTPLHEDGMPESMVVTSEQRARMTSTGVLEVMAPAWSTRSGNYLDRNSKEELRVFDKRVFYRPADTGPFQELQGDGNSMRAKDSEKLWQLTWNDRRSAISCQNPAGAVQVFDRVW